MSLSSSPRKIIPARMERRFATVPKDQLQILDHDGAWAVDPKDRQGVPPLPRHILRNIISHHGAQVLAARQAADQTSSTTQDIVPKNHHSGRGTEDKDDEHGGEDDHVNGAESRTQEVLDDNDDEGTLISGWSASPDRQPFHSLSAPEEPEFQTQISHAMHQVDRPDAHLSAFPDTVPVPAPPRPQTLRHADIMDEDDEYEEEMEVDLPGARESSQARVYLESARMQMMVSTPAATVVTQSASNETPSCAQPDERVIIPGTVSTGRSPIGREKEPQQRHRRRMRPIEFKGTTPIKRLSASSVVRLPSTSRLADVNSSMSIPSSSLIPATCASTSTQKSAAGHVAAIQVPTTIKEHNPPPSTPSQSKPDVPATQRPTLESPISQNNQVKSSPKDIYSLFTSAYPSYTASHSGTLKNFVKALVCLEYLQSERGLHEFLYDDFIRAFSSAYLQYVRNAGPGQEPLPAIEWFNLRDGPPEFSRMIITKKNLQVALQEFSEQVSLARRFIGGRPQEENGASTGRESSRQDRGASLDVDRNTCKPRENSAPGSTANSAPGSTANYARTSSVPLSSQLRSDTHEMSQMPPKSSARYSKTPSASYYFERVKSESRNRSAARSGSIDFQARLREHFRNAAAKRTLGSESRRHGSAQ
ncbi:hypothetical protein E4U21_000463 [Claviceps maximensis]|nr:hypothetical protein E4U21_000463 [Claviceps maximensis]